MARPKSFVKNVSVDIAKSSHNCKNSNTHRIKRGDKRVGVKEGRSKKHYCLACAAKFLDADIKRLTTISQEVAVIAVEVAQS